MNLTIQNNIKSVEISENKVITTTDTNKETTYYFSNKEETQSFYNWITNGNEIDDFTYSPTLVFNF